MKLYMTDVSGNSFKVRVLASILNVPLDKICVDWPAREHKSPDFLALNRRGQVPVMEIDGRILWDSTAHLVYIARKFGGEAWLPSDPLDMAEVMQWMAFAQNEVNFGLQRARGVRIYGVRPETYEPAREDAIKALEILTWHLKKGHTWLALGRPTIGDIAVYPYVMRAPEANIQLDPYPEVRAWIARCNALPGWLTLES
jgi:glutathione S-transferase